MEPRAEPWGTGEASSEARQVRNSGTEAYPALEHLRWPGHIPTGKPVDMCQVSAPQVGPPSTHNVQSGLSLSLKSKSAGNRMADALLTAPAVREPLPQRPIRRLGIAPTPGEM